MSSWANLSPQNTTRVYLDKHNGHVSTEILPYNSPFHQQQSSNGYYEHGNYHHGNEYSKTHSNGYATSARHCVLATSDGYNTQRIPNTYSSLPRPSYPPAEQHRHSSNGHVTWGMRPSLQAEHLPGMPSRNSNTSFFDMLAKSQLQRSTSNKGRRGSAQRRGSKSGLTDTLAVLRQTASNSKPDEHVSICISDYSSSYNSVIQQIREVNKESKSEAEFLVKSFRILRSTAVMTIFLVMVLLLPFGMVVLGVKYLNECPKEPFLPIYLLVGGCFTTLKMFTILWRQMRERKYSDSIDGLDGENQSDFITDKSTQFTDAVLSLFLLAWFGYGNYLTWSIFMPNFTRQPHAPSDWCEKSLYMFCVAQIIVCYSGFVVFLCTLGCLCCVRHICCFKDKYMPDKITRS